MQSYHLYTTPKISLWNRRKILFRDPWKDRTSVWARGEERRETGLVSRFEEFEEMQEEKEGS